LANNPGLKPGFLEAEDAALKMRLADIPVADDDDPQRVAQVFFRHPVGETEKSYPFITIELLDITHARDRQHSMQDLYYASGIGLTSDQQLSLTNIDYYPDEQNTADLDDLVEDSGFLSTDSYTPVDLVYQVTTYARSNQHDRQLTRTMLRRVTPFQGRGWIEIPEDGTIRRLDVQGWRPADILDGEAGYKKRIFRKVYTLVMNAEIPTSDFIGTKRTLTVEGDITSYTNTLSTDPSLSEEFSP